MHHILEKGRDLFLSISDQHFPAVVPPQDGDCFVTVRMANMSLIDLGTHTVWKIVNAWSKTPKKYAVSADEHGALTLLQMALKKGKRVILFFASGSGLTLEGAQGQTFAMQRILQLCNAKEIKVGDNSLIRHFILPYPWIPYITRPFTTHSKTVEANVPKYEIECTNAARLLLLNSSTKEKQLGNFLSSAETVGIGENLICGDPIRQALSYSIILRLRNVPNTYQSSHITKCHSPLS